MIGLLLVYLCYKFIIFAKLVNLAKLYFILVDLKFVLVKGYFTIPIFSIYAINPQAFIYDA